jgi:hypothetical protein
LFAQRFRSDTSAEPRSSAIEDALRVADPDALAPKAALELVYALKRMLAEQKK